MMNESLCLQVTRYDNVIRANRSKNTIWVTTTRENDGIHAHSFNVRAGGRNGVSS